MSRAVVIGGGLIGSFTALYLKRLGWDVTLIERDGLGGGASHGNCGYICPSHALPLSGPGVITKTLPTLLKRDAALAIPPRWDPSLWRWLWKFRGQCTRDRMMRTAAARVALLNSSKQLYDDLFADGTLTCERTERGLLVAYKSRGEFEAFAETAAMLDDEFGVRTERFEQAALNEFEPSLRPELAGGWLYTDDSHVRPSELMASLRDVLTQLGVEFREGVRLEGFRIERGRAGGVETSDGPIDADAVVVATGAEAVQWSQTLGCNIAIQPGKGYSITMDPLPHQPRVPIIFEESHVAVTPMDGAFRIGSTMEFAGFDRTLNPKRLALLRRSAAEHLVDPIPDSSGEPWCGWRPMSADGLPYIGPVPAAKNVYVASGNGMIGLATAPGTGRLAAELVSGATRHIDASPYSVNRGSTRSVQHLGHKRYEVSNGTHHSHLCSNFDCPCGRCGGS